MRSARRARKAALRVSARVGLLAAILVAMGAFAMVAGGISPPDVFAPQRPEPPNVLAAAALPPETSVAPPAELASADTRAVPSAEFIREQLAAMPTIAPGTRLSETELRVYASIAGWPADLHDEVLVVAHCESKNRPFATNGVMRGLMQMHPMWFPYSGISLNDWADPVVNLRVAYNTYRYDIARGHTPWTQWQCKPDGTVAPALVQVPADLTSGSDAPAMAASSGDTTAAPQEDAAATPTPTPAPWEQRDSWPMQSPTSEATPPATPTPLATETPAPVSTATPAP